MTRTLITGWLFLMLQASSYAASHQMTVYEHNVTNIIINGTVSVSVKMDGEATALLLFLSPVGQEVKIKTNCNSSEGLNSKTDKPMITTGRRNKGNVVHPLSQSVVSSSFKSRPAKVTLDDIVAVRVSGESTSLVENKKNDSPTVQSPLATSLPRAKNCLEVQQLKNADENDDTDEDDDDDDDDGVDDENKKKSGVYIIYPYDCCPDRSVSVYCDMNTDGGGWTVIQRRDLYPQQEDFYRDWQSYADGFDNLMQEFWLGLEVIHALTNQSDHEIRFDLKDFEGETRWAKYSFFDVDSAFDDYRMVVEGFSGDAGDSFTRHSGMTFATKDHQSPDNCASTYKGAWWYSICHDSNLNGQYLLGQHTSYADGVNWRAWHGYYYSLKFTEIKIRPRGI